MTAPYLKKSTLIPTQLRLSESLLREFDTNPALTPAELLRPPQPVTVELFRPEALPSFGKCGVLRNNSAFGCSYLDKAGHENKLGVDFNTYPGGLGLSLKFFLGG